MKLTNENEHEYRYKTHGPKYLTQGPMIDMGVVVIGVGEEHSCHKHEHQEESFLVLEGACAVYLDGKRVVIQKGDYLQCDVGESHMFINEFNEPFKAVFIKAPHLDFKDSVYIDWKPGMEFIKD
jgi:mannose-6-phosphate isomerase-like protein (cupin superfamily)